MPLAQLYRYLHCDHFTRDELEAIFDRIVSGGVGVVVPVDPPSPVTRMMMTTTATTTAPVMHQTNLEQYLWTRIAELEVESDLCMANKKKKMRKEKEKMHEDGGTLPDSVASSSSFTSSSSSSTLTEGDWCPPSTSQNRTYDPDRQLFITREAQRILQLLLVEPSPPSSSTSSSPSSSHVPPHVLVGLTKVQFVDRVLTLASAVDHARTAPVLVSMLLVGASVGVITPAMPFVVQALQLSAAQYGGVVAAFGLAKMIGNIPAAIAVERHGRKPYMTYSLAVIAVGVGGIGFASSFETLYLCRLLTGFGVAALSTAGTLMITDVSTPLNRASTYAPVMSAFAAGTAFGPALGGMMVDQLGLHATFYVVGLSYLGVAMVNNAILSETKSRPMEFPWQKEVSSLASPASSSSSSSAAAAPWRRERSDSEAETFRDAIQGAIGQWVPLFRDPLIRSVMIMNGVYWIALAGGQMTLLPLILTNDLNFTATQVGQVYMGMSMIQIFGNPIFGKLIDRVGKAPVMIGATTCIGTAMYMLPYACAMDPTTTTTAAAAVLGTAATTVSMESLWPLAATLGLWSVGSSMLSTAPLAYVSDRVDDHQRAQAIALLRTCGDIGFLIGATGTGALADYTNSFDLALQSNAALLLSATVWFAVRQILLSRPHVTVADTEASNGPR
jgi:MFS family permease